MSDRNRAKRNARVQAVLDESERRMADKAATADDRAVELITNWRWMGMQMNEEHARALLVMLAERGLVLAIKQGHPS